MNLREKWALGGVLVAPVLLVASIAFNNDHLDGAIDNLFNSASSSGINAPCSDNALQDYKYGDMGCGGETYSNRLMDTASGGSGFGGPSNR